MNYISDKCLLQSNADDHNDPDIEKNCPILWTTTRQPAELTGGGGGLRMKGHFRRDCE